MVLPFCCKYSIILDKYFNYKDTTNPNSTNWFVSELEKVRADAGIDSFKFDAGEIEWLPKNFWMVNDTSKLNFLERNLMEK